MIALIVNNQTGSVHLASCGIGLRSAYATEWTHEHADPDDWPCSLCLPDGIPPEDAKPVYSDTDSPPSDAGETDRSPTP